MGGRRSRSRRRHHLAQIGAGKYRRKSSWLSACKNRKAADPKPDRRRRRYEQKPVYLESITRHHSCRLPTACTTTTLSSRCNSANYPTCHSIPSPIVSPLDNIHAKAGTYYTPACNYSAARETTPCQPKPFQPAATTSRLMAHTLPFMPQIIGTSHHRTYVYSATCK